MKGGIIIKEFKPDPLSKDFIRDNEIFADLCNGLLFKGKQFIKPENVRELDTDSTTQTYDRTIVRRGDIVKEVSINGKQIIVRIENQQKPDKTMPIRTGEYTILKYNTQMKNGKELLPIYTFTLYYREANWSFPTEIKDMVIIPEGLENIFQNWNANVVDIKKVDSNLFHHEDLKGFIKAVQQLYFWDKKLESLEEIKLSKRSALLAGVVTGTTALVNKVLENKGGKIEMCKAIEEYGLEREQKGIEQGIEYTRIISIKNIIRNLNLTLPEAINALNIPIEEQYKYLDLLS